MLKASRYLPAMLLTVGVGVGTPACASQMYAYRGGNNQNIQRLAYDNGYREGIEEGRDDASHRRAFSPTRHDEYRDADQGYRRGDGNIEFYRQTFRQGFQAGYAEAFNQAARAFPRVAPYPVPGTPGLAGINVSAAAQVGYRDGLEVGRDDARDRDRYDPARSGRYRSADHDYDRRYGPRDQYQREYRVAFERGYDEGYRNSRR